MGTRMSTNFDEFRTISRQNNEIISSAFQIIWIFAPKIFQICISCFMYRLIQRKKGWTGKTGKPLKVPKSAPCKTSRPLVRPQPLSSHGMRYWFDDVASNSIRGRIWGRGLERPHVVRNLCPNLRVGPFGKSCQHRPASLTLAVDSPPEHFEPNWRSVGACAILRQASKVLAS